MSDTIFELRDYLMKPARRDDLTTLFEARFIEPQDAVGAHVRGIFTDPKAPDHFIWLRSFADMDSRQTALQTFYGGEIWHANREAANDTMIDSDNVDLLIPLLSPRAVVGDGALVLDVLSAAAIARDDLVAASGSAALAVFTTAGLENNFPRLPVNSRAVHVVLWRQGSGPAPTYVPDQRRVLVPTQRSRIR